ncbi:MAG: hypothetical protein ACF788_06870, partial [Novipirellula sp. JB048]
MSHRYSSRTASSRTDRRASSPESRSPAAAEPIGLEHLVATERRVPPVRPAESILSLIARLGTPPRDVVEQWCRQVQAIAEDLHTCCGVPLPAIDLSRWWIDARGRVGWQASGLDRCDTLTPDPNPGDRRARTLAINEQRVREFRDRVLQTHDVSAPGADHQDAPQQDAPQQGAYRHPNRAQPNRDSAPSLATIAQPALHPGADAAVLSEAESDAESDAEPAAELPSVSEFLLDQSESQPDEIAPRSRRGRSRLIATALLVIVALCTLGWWLQRLKPVAASVSGDPRVAERPRRETSP